MKILQMKRVINDDIGENPNPKDENPKPRDEKQNDEKKIKKEGKVMLNIIKNEKNSLCPIF